MRVNGAAAVAPARAYKGDLALLDDTDRAPGMRVPTRVGAGGHGDLRDDNVQTLFKAKASVGLVGTSAQFLAFEYWGWGCRCRRDCVDRYDQPRKSQRHHCQPHTASHKGLHLRLPFSSPARQASVTSRADGHRDQLPASGGRMLGATLL